MTTTTYSQSDLIRLAGSATQHADVILSSAHRAGNDAGNGYDPEPEIDSGDWTQIRRASTTDDVSAYTYTDEAGDLWLVLVGTDGTGSDDSRWAVRIGDVGVDL